MKIKHIILCTLLVSILSCGKTNPQKDLVIVTDSIKNNKIKSSYTEIKLNSKALKAVKNWKEYQKIDKFIKQYHIISKSDALFNANELSELTQQLKDSISIDKFQIPSVKIRLNVLHNEALRLADMATINNINELEIKEENENILNAYSAFKLKINNMMIQEDLNKEVDKFIEEIENLSDTNKSLDFSQDSIKNN